MPLYKFQVTFPTDSNIPKDFVTNSWHFFRTGVAPISDFDNVRDMLKDFYTVAPPLGGAALSTFISNVMNGPAIVKAYNLADPLPRVPSYESTFPITPSGSGSLPAEVAVVLSFQAARASGQSQARRRNRIYFGPLGTGALNSSGRPDTTLITQMQRCANALQDASVASASWDWVVYSPTNGTQEIVDNGWIDNAFDTQRRRGLAPTSRTTFS